MMTTKPINRCALRSLYGTKESPARAHRGHNATWVIQLQRVGFGTGKKLLTSSHCQNPWMGTGTSGPKWGALLRKLFTKKSGAPEVLVLGPYGLTSSSPEPQFIHEANSGWIEELGMMLGKHCPNQNPSSIHRPTKQWVNVRGGWPDQWSMAAKVGPQAVALRRDQPAELGDTEVYSRNQWAGT